MPKYRVGIASVAPTFSQAVASWRFYCPGQTHWLITGRSRVKKLIALTAGAVGATAVSMARSEAVSPPRTTMPDRHTPTRLLR